MKYLVIQKYYDSGKTLAYVREVDDNAEDFGPIEFDTYDEYGNVFNTAKEANKFKRDTLNA
jgi:hypothetical protein